MVKYGLAIGLQSGLSLSHYLWNPHYLWILLLSYKALNDPAPSYLKDLIVRYFPNRALRSQTAGLLVVPRVSKSRM